MDYIKTIYKRQEEVKKELKELDKEFSSLALKQAIKTRELDALNLLVQLHNDGETTQTLINENTANEILIEQPRLFNEKRKSAATQIYEYFVNNPAFELTGSEVKDIVEDYIKKGRIKPSKQKTIHFAHSILKTLRNSKKIKLEDGKYSLIK